MGDKIREYMVLSFRVVHNNGDVIAGFTTLDDAEADAIERNEKAKTLGLACKYAAIPKP